MVSLKTCKSAFNLKMINNKHKENYNNNKRTTMGSLMSYNNIQIGDSYIESEAEVIAVKIQDFKGIPTCYLSNPS